MDHEKNALCDNYTIECVHDATKHYYDRGRYAYIYIYIFQQHQVSYLYVESFEVMLVLPSFAS